MAAAPDAPPPSARFAELRTISLMSFCLGCDDMVEMRMGERKGGRSGGWTMMRAWMRGF